MSSGPGLAYKVEPSSHLCSPQHTPSLPPMQDRAQQAPGLEMSPFCEERLQGLSHCTPCPPSAKPGWMG